MPETSKFYVTTPIYYVNARPHIGHAYTTIVADVLARRHRLQYPASNGGRTWFLTGTDEHGQKIERSAAAAGIAPQQFADEVSASFQSLWARMGITNDQYIRTTNEAHKRGAQKLFRELYDRGHIYLASYTGQYCVSEEMFVEGPPGTIGPDGKPTETVTEENFFFRLSDFQLPLLDLIESDTLAITPEARKNEVLSFLRGNVSEASASQDLSSLGEAGGSAVRLSAAGTPYVHGALRDLSVSRSSFTWGIPVPEPAASAAKEKHVMYVWLDALANYMTAVGYGDDSPEAQAKFASLWPADLHTMAKEITRQHCVYWPAFLLALNPALARTNDGPAPQLTPAQHAEWAAEWLPKAVTAHGWLLFDNSKMSKSKGNIVRTEIILDAFGTLCPSNPVPPAVHSAPLSSSREAGSAVPVASTEPTPHDRDLFASDVLRYFLLREIPFGQDGSFTFDALITRYNADLANGYGNLVSRTLKMMSANSPTVHSVPEEPYICPDREAWWGDEHRELDDIFSGTGFIISKIESLVELFAGRFGNVGLNALLAEVQLCISHVDSYLSFHKPWNLAKSPLGEDKAKLSEVLYTAGESIRIITALLFPFLPYATASVWRQLGLDNIEKDAADGKLKNLKWGGLKPGHPTGPLAPFPRADKKLADVMQQMEQDRSDREQLEKTRTTIHRSTTAMDDQPDDTTVSQPNLTGDANAAHDASHSSQGDFAKAPIASEEPAAGEGTSAGSSKHLSKLVDETSGHTSITNPGPFDPAAGPRTGTLHEPNPGAQVAASTAQTMRRPVSPPHGEAQSSGIFSGQPADASPQASPQITIDDFAKIELRVAQVVVCERIPKADKLLRLEVDLGDERRQILSGIAEWYTPEELVGRRIVVITNLAPRKMRGLESHGMLLAASSDGGKPYLATFADADGLPLGSRLK
jgi:methionyl-tRNA synthetase